MRQRMKNSLRVTVKGVDLMLASNIEFYVKQAEKFFIYKPEIISSTEMLVQIPYEDAMKLTSGECRIQFALTDENKNPVSVDPKSIPVGVLLKEAGYDPV